MEGLFASANRDVILHVLLKRHLFDRDGLALVLTCKFLYGLTTPIMRLQMRAGLRRRVLELDVKACKSCDACNMPREYHASKYRCPMTPHICNSARKCVSTVQLSVPWVLLPRYAKLHGISCAHCKLAIEGDFRFATEACALCGIYCDACDAYMCPGCDQTVRGRDHVCTAHVDRLTRYVNGMRFDVNRLRIATLEKHETPHIMVTGTFHSGTRFMWVLVADKNRVPPIARGDCGCVYVVVNTRGNEFVSLLHYERNNRPYGEYRGRQYNKAHLCVVCFQTIANKHGRFCGRICKMKHAAQ